MVAVHLISLNFPSSTAACSSDWVNVNLRCDSKSATNFLLLAVEDEGEADDDDEGNGQPRAKKV
jgi:hypothetical protein